MARHKMPDYPYVQARNVGGKQRPTAIVLHLSNTTSEKGAALGVANYHHRHDSPLKSYHYIVDEEMIYRCVPTNVAAYGNPHQAINVLICAEPQEDVTMWGYGETTKITHRATELVADLMLTHRIPARSLIGASELRWFNHRWRRRGGLMWHGLGTWPHVRFLDEVKSQMVIKSM